MGSSVIFSSLTHQDRHNKVKSLTISYVFVSTEPYDVPIYIIDGTLPSDHLMCFLSLPYILYLSSKIKEDMHFKPFQVQLVTEKR